MNQRSLFLPPDFARQSFAPLATPSPRAPLQNNALLIQPFCSSSLVRHSLAPPLGLTTVAAATPPHWALRLHDENRMQGPLPGDPLPDVVGITVSLACARRAYAIARWYRARGAKVVMGGLHVQSCPDEVAQHADAIAVGEGVTAWPRMLADVERGSLQRVYVGSYRGQYRDEPAPRRELLDRGCFVTTASVMAMRGVQTRRPEQVAEEIRRTDQRSAVFLDENLGSRKEYLRRLCRALTPLEIVWSAGVTIDLADDPPLVREMAHSGCVDVLIELGTASRDDRVAVFHDHGIQVNGSFVFGYEDDGLDVFARTVDWIEEQRLARATFRILTPFPGTPLFQRMDTAGRLLHRDWGKYDEAHVVFRPRRMTPAQLMAGYAWCCERILSGSPLGGMCDAIPL